MSVQISYALNFRVLLKLIVLTYVTKLVSIVLQTHFKNVMVSLKICSDGEALRIKATKLVGKLSQSSIETFFFSQNKRLQV